MHRLIQNKYIFCCKGSCRDYFTHILPVAVAQMLAFICPQADVFSYGIILCEIIARIQADPDFLPRTEVTARLHPLQPLQPLPSLLKPATLCIDVTASLAGEK